jgi:hypothetical protein
VLKADNLRLKRRVDGQRNKRRREAKNAARARKSNDMGGCQQVTIAAMAPSVTGMEGVQMVSEVDSAEPALGGGGAAMKKRCRVKGEVAQDKLIVELNGGKAIRRATSGKKLGGLEWKDSVMAGAVANWAMNSLSFKAAGKTANAGLRIQGVRFWFKAEPLRNYKSRRNKKGKLEIPLRDISTPSMREGVFAMELAKNCCFYEKLVQADAVALCVDYGSVSDKSFQASHLRTFTFQEGGTDGANAMWLTVIADSMVLDVWPVGDKKLEATTYIDEAGEQRCLPVEAPQGPGSTVALRWDLLDHHALSMSVHDL